MRGEGPRRGGGGSTSPRARRLAAQFPDLEVEGFHGPLGPLSLSRPWRSGEGRRAGGRGRAGVVEHGGTGRGRAGRRGGCRHGIPSRQAEWKGAGEGGGEGGAWQGRAPVAGIRSCDAKRAALSLASWSWSAEHKDGAFPDLSGRVPPRSLLRARFRENLKRKRKMDRLGKLCKG